MGWALGASLGAKLARPEKTVLHPDGFCSSRDEYSLSRVEPAPDSEKIVEANGGYGERVEDPGYLLPALRRGMQVVRDEGRRAVRTVMCRVP